MITISHDENEVTITLTIQAFSEEHEIDFAWTSIDNEAVASIVAEKVSEELDSFIREVRKNAYMQGRKDAKAKVRCNQYHSGRLDTAEYGGW